MENLDIKKLVKVYIEEPERYTYTEMDDVDLYEFVFQEDRIIWQEELTDLKYYLDESAGIQPLACMGVGTTEDALPVLRIELWKEK